MLMSSVLFLTLAIVCHHVGVPMSLISFLNQGVIRIQVSDTYAGVVRGPGTFFAGQYMGTKGGSNAVSEMQDSTSVPQNLCFKCKMAASSFDESHCHKMINFLHSFTNYHSSNPRQPHFIFQSIKAKTLQLLATHLLFHLK